MIILVYTAVPQCRETFTTRPVLGRNTILAEMVEKLKKTGLQAAPPAHCYAGPGDVVCDVCTGRKRKAVKSCLVCLASYCEIHLKLHNELHPGNTHNVINATGNLQDSICLQHKKLLEVYCRTDQQCICYLCTMDEHSGHKTVSAAAERTEKQKQLGATQSKFQQRIQEREKELQDLRQAVQSLKCSAQAAVEDSERIFTELIRSIERRRSEVKELIRDQEKAEEPTRHSTTPDTWKMSIFQSPGPERTSYNIPVGSHWTPTQRINSSVCLRGTERSRAKRGNADALWIRDALWALPLPPQSWVVEERYAPAQWLH
ncbi:hypothetical protein SKAU_G00421580 [Synaphobranchus kaupii]|uniref:B box-type domain-containing protein n=1 Tax=Synaphobranchus kaupii TaxID=118154 RepID=A0A9Q1E6W1_SYNKA|nr:hypothetical protein SKAU_G00421580 [Synaphobranchus kaupii]